jgi:hypothetical protein
MFEAHYLAFIADRQTNLVALDFRSAYPTFRYAVRSGALQGAE